MAISDERQALLRTSYALICDDHPWVGRGLCELLKNHPFVNGCVCTPSSAECLRLITLHGVPAVVMMDLWFANGAAEALIRQLSSSWPQLPVLMMSADDDPAVQIKSEQWGAKGFISKQASPGVVREAVSAVIQGLGWFMPLDNDVLATTSRASQWPITARELGLTSRQGQTLSLILQGLPNKLIARNLNVTEATVKEHVTGVLRKLQVKTRIEAMTKLKNRCLEVD